MARPKKVVEEQVNKTAPVSVAKNADERVVVELKDKNLKTYTVYLPYGFVKFEGSKASVLLKTRDILKNMGVI